jgi:hypothetical protein
VGSRDRVSLCLVTFVVWLLLPAPGYAQSAPADVTQETPPAKQSFVAGWQDGFVMQSANENIA